MEIKAEIIEKVNATKDIATLKEILKLLTVEPEAGKTYYFTETEMQKVEEGIDDADNGRVYGQEKADKLISEWLKEKSFGR